MALAVAAIRAPACKIGSMVAAKPPSTPALRWGDGRQYASSRSGLIHSVNRPFLQSGHRVSPGVIPRRPPARTGALGLQMNAFSRLARVFRSNTNTLINSAEDPEKILDQAVLDMRADLAKLRQAAAQVLASQRMMESKANQAKATADLWYRRAETAIARGEESLAREALQRRKTYQLQADQWEAQLGTQKTAFDKLQGNSRVLQSKLQEVSAKKDALKARAASAKSTKEVNEMLYAEVNAILGSLTDSSSAYAAFQRMEEKVIAMEAESEAVGLIGASGKTDGLEAKFAALELTDADAELADMKKQLRGRKQLPEGRTINYAVDLEIEALRRRLDDDK